MICLWFLIPGFILKRLEIRRLPGSFVAVDFRRCWYQEVFAFKYRVASRYTTKGKSQMFRTVSQSSNLHIATSSPTWSQRVRDLEAETLPFDLRREKRSERRNAKQQLTNQSSFPQPRIVALGSPSLHSILHEKNDARRRCKRWGIGEQDIYLTEEVTIPLMNAILKECARAGRVTMAVLEIRNTD